MIEPNLSFELSAIITHFADYTNKRNQTEQQAILHAFQKQTFDESERNKTIFIVHNLLLRPLLFWTQKKLMNRDWRHNTQAKYFIAVNLDRSILLNTKKKSSCYDQYGRIHPWHVYQIPVCFHINGKICTRFHLPNTYTLVRASGPLTKNHTWHPYTVFTLIDCDRGRSPCPALFDTIVIEILKNGTKANLMKSVETMKMLLAK